MRFCRLAQVNPDIIGGLVVEIGDKYLVRSYCGCARAQAQAHALVTFTFMLRALALTRALRRHRTCR
jgi:hypothetical protein